MGITPRNRARRMNERRQRRSGRQFARFLRVVVMPALKAATMVRVGEGK
jgi:hypothetical protein